MSTYSARGFGAPFAAGQDGGRLLVATASVVFESDSGTRLEWPLDGLSLALGGTIDEQVFLRHPVQPDVVIATTDLAFLADPAIVACPPLAAQAASFQRQRRRRNTVPLGCGIVLLVLGLLAVGIWLAKESIVHWLADRIPDSVTSALSEAALTAVRSESHGIEDENVTRAVAELTRTLLSGLPTGIQVRFHVVDDPTLNAFALPSGDVVLNRGFLLAAESPEEVLGVVAHELAHVSEKHGLRNLIGSVGVMATAQMLFGDAGSLVGAGGRAGAELLSLRYSRDFEREADAVGLRSLQAAGIDGGGLVRFLERLAAEPNAVEVPTLLSTHPATTERLERLRQAAGPPSPALPRASFERLQAALSERQDVP